MHEYEVQGHLLGLALVTKTWQPPLPHVLGASNVECVAAWTHSGLRKHTTATRPYVWHVHFRTCKYSGADRAFGGLAVVEQATQLRAGTSAHKLPTTSTVSISVMDVESVLFAFHQTYPERPSPPLK